MFIVKHKGEPESHWCCEREVVVDYIDGKPCKNPNSRNSIEVIGDWKIFQLLVFTSLQEKKDFEHRELVESGLGKLTNEEQVALGIRPEQEYQAP